MHRFAALVLLCVVACSKSKPKEEAAGSAANPPAPVVVADAAVVEDAAPVVVDAAAPAAEEETTDFDKLSHDEQVKFMKTKVMPAMKPLFQKFDPKDYANFGCKTCHGKDPQKSKYKMPNKDLKPLDFAAIKAGKEDPKMIEFMSKTVKPEMAKIMGEPEMTETNPNGFGCLECHTMKK
jgi:hypothetical protein